MQEKLNKFKLYTEKQELFLSNDIFLQFEKFAQILTEYNSHTNLLSANDINLVYEKHFTDSISFLKILNPEQKIKLLDIGSGGGFPVIPISIILKKSEILSIDSTAKKVDFLNAVAQNINLTNFKSINVRAEELAHNKDFREKFDFVTIRAVGNLALISELALPFLKIGGKFIAYKSAKVNEELELAQSAIQLLGGKISQIIEYNLDLEENFVRNLVIIEKITSTDNIYPRKYNLIKSKPL